jgi:flavin-dependent dehydrogenase
VVGGGIAGITCAKELHTFGYEVEIFEAAARETSTRPRQMEGSVNFFENVPELEVDKQMRKLEIHSPKVTVSLKGNLGFFYEVGDEKSIEIIARKSIDKFCTIHYSTRVRNREQLQDFDFVVAADGYQSLLAKEYGLRSENPKRVGVGVGFTVEGDFDPERMEIWFDNHFSHHGYAYAIPFSKHEASLVSASIGRIGEPRIYRERLKEIAMSKDWKLKDEWVDFENWYDFSSYCKDNFYVIGNAGSFIEPAFGFGIKWAIKSAKLCAEAIHRNLDYSNSIKKHLMPDFGAWKVMRKFFESAEDNDYDMFVKSFENPLARDLVESGKSILCKLKPEETTQNVIFVPQTLTLDRFLKIDGKGLVAVAYCIKSFDCPKKRYSEYCELECKKCDMSSIKKESEKVGFDFIVATDDDDFLRFLKHNGSKYKRLIAVTCPYTFNKIAYPVHLIFGLNGLVIPLRGDVCTSEDKYMSGVEGEKSTQTKTDLQTFFNIMDRIQKQ